MQAPPYGLPAHAPYGIGSGPTPDGMPPQGYGAAPPSFQASQYEFGPPENEVIARAGSWTRQAGVIQIIFTGVLPMLLGVFSAASGKLAVGIGQVVGGLPAIFIGVAVASAGKNLSRVANTQGNDIALLISALRSYTRAFKIQAVLMCLGFMLGFALGFLGSIMR